MDRFIVDRAQLQSIVPLNLKSNMDRFIAYIIMWIILLIMIFKIQYG